MGFVSTNLIVAAIALTFGLAFRPLSKAFLLLLAERRFKRLGKRIERSRQSLSKRAAHGYLPEPVLAAMRMHLKMADDYHEEARAPLRLHEDHSVAFDKLYWAKHCLDEAEQVLARVRASATPLAACA